MNDLKGLNAYITGGSRGIGKVIATQLAQSGVNIAIISRNQSESGELAAQLQRDYGVQTWSFATDVSRPESVEKLEKELRDKLPRLDIAFNNAGVCKHQDAFSTSYEDWRYVIDINLTGVFLSSRMAARLMIEKKVQGSIINMASMSARIVNIPQRQCAYNASKAGVVHLSRSLAVEWAEHGIRVNTISPGYMATEMSTDTPQEMKNAWFGQSLMPRLGKPEELFGAIRYLASPASGFTTGSDIVVDGGFTCL